MGCLLVMYQTGDIAFCKILLSTWEIYTYTKVPMTTMFWFVYSFNLMQKEWNDNDSNFGARAQFQRTQSIVKVVILSTKEIFLKLDPHE